MSPKGKAEQLFSLMKFTMSTMFTETNKNYSVEEWNDVSKQCALIAVDEIIEIVDDLSSGHPLQQIDYWQQVKTELENL